MELHQSPFCPALLFIYLLGCDGFLFFVFVFFWSTVNIKYYVSYKCTIWWFLIFKGYIPFEVIRKYFLYFPCSTIHPLTYIKPNGLNLLIPYPYIAPPPSTAAAAAAAKSLQLWATLCDPIDGSPLSLRFSRQEYWSGVAISFSNAWKWKVKVKSLSRVQLLATSWTVTYQAAPSADSPGKSSGVGCHCLLHLPPLVITNLFSVSVSPPPFCYIHQFSMFPRIHMGHHPCLLCLTCFIQHHAFQVHACCCISVAGKVAIIFLWLSNIPVCAYVCVCVCILHLLYPFICWWTFRLLPYVGNSAAKNIGMHVSLPCLFILKWET